MTIPRFTMWPVLGLALLVLVNVPSDAATMAAGREHSAVALPDGSVWVWGGNARGQLGDGTNDPSTVPVQVLGLTDVVALASGDAHLLALTGNGDVWAWGANDSGQVGDGSNEDRHLPVLVLRGATKIDAGPEFSTARKSDGSLWRWGAGLPAEFKNEKASPSNTPELISTISNIERPDTAAIELPDAVALAAGGSHWLARLEDGTVWTRGRNQWGQLGNGTLIGRPEPGPIVLERIVEIAAGNEHSLAVTDDGVVWTWGRNTAGQLGDGTTESSPVPIAISEPGFRWKAGRPVLDPPGGTYETVLDVTITSATDGASILYSTAPEGVPNTEVDSGGTARLDETATLLARSSAPDHPPSDVTAADYLFRLTSVRFVPGGGIFSEPQRVQLIGPEGASVHYTSDGSVPDESSALFADPILVDRDTVLQARAFRPGWQPSVPASARYRFADAGTPAIPDALVGEKVEDEIFSDGFESGDTANWSATFGRPPPPEIAPEAGFYEGSVEVSLTCTGGTTARYTIDGIDPTAESTVYVGPFTLTETTTVKAVCFREPSWISAVVARVYSVGQALGRPAFSPPRGSYGAPIEVSITPPPDAIEVRYTTDGTTPTVTSPVFSDPIPVQINLTIRAIAVGPEGQLGLEAAAEYTLEVAQPALEPPGGVSTGPAMVTVTATTPDTSVHYTLDGGEPTETSPEVALSGSEGTIEIDSSSTLKVKAFKTGWAPSFTTTANYLIVAGEVAVPTADPPAGVYPGSQSVTLSCATDGATVYFTTDGSEPSLASPIYDAQIPVEASSVLRARAFKAEHLPSPTETFIYTIGDGPLSTPLIDPPPGNYAVSQAVTVTSADPGAALHYTTDGSEPGEDDPEIVPGTPLLIDRITRLRVRAFDDGREPSEILTADYFITGAVAAGHISSLALDAAGVVWAWGDSDYGELPAPPEAIAGLPPIRVIAAGTEHFLAVDEDGAVWAWGTGTDGALGNGSTSSSTTPVAVTATWGATEVLSVGAGEAFSVALLADGTVWAWGRNAVGQLGDGSGSARSTTPVAVGGGTPIADATAIAVGRAHALALTATGTVLAWGENTSGQLGDGTTVDADLPVAVDTTSGPPPDLHGVAAGGSHSAAVTNDGGLWTWGLNGDGQLAQADTESQFLAPVAGAQPPDINSAALGLSHSLVVDSTLHPWAVGRNVERQLGDGSTISRTEFVPIFNLDGVAALAAGDTHSLAIRIDGAVWAWGTNLRGEVGEGAGPRTPFPVEVPGLRLAENLSMGEDPDGDGLATAVELRLGSDPWDPDSNDDGVSDGASAGAGIDPTSNDSDGDGLPNTAEDQLGTDPLDPDTDGDGIDDATDAYPLDPSRWETPEANPADTTPPTITVLEPSNAIPIQ